MFLCVFTLLAVKQKVITGLNLGFVALMMAFTKKKEGKKPNFLWWGWSRRSGLAPVMEGLRARLEGVLSSAPGSTKSQHTFLTNLCQANTYRPPGTDIS